MLKEPREFAKSHPYLTALASGAFWNIAFTPKAEGLPIGLVSSGVLIGVVVGFYRVNHWKDLFKKFPYALGCFLLMGCLAGVLAFSSRGSRGDMDGLLLIGVPIISLFFSPLVLVGEGMGWLLGCWLKSDPIEVAR